MGDCRRTDPSAREHPRRDLRVHHWHDRGGVHAAGLARLCPAGERGLNGSGAAAEAMEPTNAIRMATCGSTVSMVSPSASTASPGRVRTPISHEAPTATTRFRRDGERMRVDLVSHVLESFDIDFALVLAFSNGATVRVEGPFELSRPHRVPVVIDPEAPDSRAASKLVPVGRTVLDAVIRSDNGSLILVFDGGCIVRVPSSPEFEAWSVTHSDGGMVVSHPGGDLSEWGAR